jgi:hypothetical protein
MPELHSKHSASNFEANTLCPGRRVMSEGIADRGSKYADEGTAAHALLEQCIQSGHTAAQYLGASHVVNGTPWPVTEDMATAVQTALDNIREIVGDGMLLSEQRVNYASYLGVPEDEGGARATSSRRTRQRAAGPRLQARHGRRGGRRATTRR